jgi:hypothetical protein
MQINAHKTLFGKNRGTKQPKQPSIIAMLLHKKMNNTAEEGYKRS